MQDRLHPVLMLAAGIMLPPGYTQQQPAFAQRPHRHDHYLSARLLQGPRENQGLVVAVLWTVIRAVDVVIVKVPDDECVHAGMLTMTFQIWSGWLQEGHVTRDVAAGLSWLTSSVAGRHSCRLCLRMLSFFFFFFPFLFEGGRKGCRRARELFV